MPLFVPRPARAVAQALGLLALVGLGACEEYGGSDTGSDGDVNLVVAGFWSTAASSGHDFHVLVENTGADAAGSFQVRIYLQEDEPAAGYASEGQTSVSSLASGAVEEVVVNVPSSVTGETAWVVVDGAASIDETFEDDNTSGPLSVADR